MNALNGADIIDSEISLTFKKCFGYDMYMKCSYKEAVYTCCTCICSCSLFISIILKTNQLV